MKGLIFGITLILLCGCGHAIDYVIEDYKHAANYVSLGDSKEKVLQILSPSQAGLFSNERKMPEKFIKGSDKIEIHFMRSGRQADGLTTDDEFTPYYFKNGILVGIGWQQLGGPKTQGQVVPVTNVNVSNTVISN